MSVGTTFFYKKLNPVVTLSGGFFPDLTYICVKCPQKDRNIKNLDNWVKISLNPFLLLAQ